MNVPPRITVITPSFNQARFLERTICSALDQAYDALEYVIVDAGSCDGSIDIIRRYEHDLAWWVSEADAGPAAAINRALQFATGELVCILPSDDLLAPGALHLVADRLASIDPSHAPQWLVGGAAVIDAHDRLIDHLPARSPLRLIDYLRDGDALPQPATFFRRELLQRLGGFDTALTFRYPMEFDCRLLAAGLRPTILDATIAHRRRHAMSMTARDPLAARREQLEVTRLYARRLADHDPPIALPETPLRAAA